jgi:hypothetical protein
VSTDKKQKRPFFVSPKGRLQFPHLLVPDTKFDAAGRLGTKLITPADDAEDFLKLLAPLHAEAVAAAEAGFPQLSAEVRKKLAKKGITAPIVNDLYSEELDEDEQPTGNIVFNFSTKALAKFKNRKGEEETYTRKIAVFDSRGNPITDAKLQIWSGTIARVTCVAVPYWVPGQVSCGVSLRPVAVKVLELVSGGQRSADQFGLGGDEDGYEYQAPETGEDTPRGESQQADPLDDL